jgi:L-rhamnose mutarotase
MARRFVLTLDLRDDPEAIRAYREHHRAVWPEVLRSLRRVGVRAMDIYALGRRLVMVLVTRDGFDLERDFAAHAASDPRCAEWEALMKTFQAPPPGARPGELWAPMEPIFHLGAAPGRTGKRGATRRGALRRGRGARGGANGRGRRRP